jgi:hypothetical protein
MARMTRDLRRIGIYPYHKSSSVYYDKRTKVFYTVPNEEIKKFELFSNRYVMGIIVGIMAFYLIKLDPIYCVLLGVATMIGLEVYFRVILLKKYDVVRKPEIGELYDRKNELRRQIPRILLVKSLAYFGASGAIFIYLYFYSYPIEQEIAIAVLALYAIYNGFVNLSVYMSRKK